MYVVAVGEALGIFVVLLACALLVIWLGRNGANQRVVHGAAVFVVLFLALSLGALEAIPLYLAPYASAHVALVLQWTYRRAERMPPNGFARLYAVFAGFLLVIAATVAGGWYSEATARNIARQREASAARIVDPYAAQMSKLRPSTLPKELPSELTRTSSVPADVMGSSRIQWDDEKPPEKSEGNKKLTEREATGNRFAKYSEQATQQTLRHQLENPIDRFDQLPAATSKAVSALDGYSDWERDPWTGAGVAGCFLWLACLAGC